MRRVLSILLENSPGSLSRIVGLFSQRAFNIESLTVAPTEDSSVSRITITTFGDTNVIEQIVKQVNKLIDVIKVTDLTTHAHIERELLLIKVVANNNESRTEVKRIADIYRGGIIDVGKETYTIEITGDCNKINAFITTLDAETTILEVVRSGVVGISRGDKALAL